MLSYTLLYIDQREIGRNYSRTLLKQSSMGQGNVFVIQALLNHGCENSKLKKKIHTLEKWEHFVITQILLY